MFRLAARSVALVARTLIVGSWSARMWLLGFIVALLVFGGSALGPVTIQTLGLLLMLFMMVVVFRLLVGGGRR